MTTASLDAVTLRALTKMVVDAENHSVTVEISSGTLNILIGAYIDRAALIVVNDQMEKQGAEIAPYWAHHMMARVLSRGTCDLISSKNPDTCRGSSLCITEYCPHCYAKVWYESQHKHKAQRHRDGMPKKNLECICATLPHRHDCPKGGAL